MVRGRIWHKKIPERAPSAGNSFIVLSQFYVFDFHAPLPQQRCLIIVIKFKSFFL
jgi:hypothetical protein